MDSAISTQFIEGFTSGQKAAVALDFLPELEKEAKKRQAIAGNKGSLPQKIAEAGESREKLATQFDTNRQYVSDVKMIKTKKPKLFEEVKVVQKLLYEVRL